MTGSPAGQRRPLTRVRLIVAIMVAALPLAVAACATDPMASSSAASAAAASAPAPAPSSPVVGVVIDVDSAGLGDVRGFTLRSDDGRALVFTVGRLEPGSFDPGHLAEHVATGVPVEVTFVAEGEVLVATKLADA